VSELRKYRPGDFDRLLEIDEACFVAGVAYSPDEMRYFLAQSSALTLVATENGKIQGFIIADRFRQRRGARFMGRVITIDVAPRSQHSGLGTLLLTASIRNTTIPCSRSCRDIIWIRLTGC
jgi:L-amino acid N-acyltransferase YncA